MFFKNYERRRETFFSRVPIKLVQKFKESAHTLVNVDLKVRESRWRNKSEDGTGKYSKTKARGEISSARRLCTILDT